MTERIRDCHVTERIRDCHATPCYDAGVELHGRARPDHDANHLFSGQVYSLRRILTGKIILTVFF